MLFNLFNVDTNKYTVLVSTPMKYHNFLRWFLFVPIVFNILSFFNFLVYEEYLSAIIIVPFIYLFIKAVINLRKFNWVGVKYMLWGYGVNTIGNVFLLIDDWINFNDISNSLGTVIASIIMFTCTNIYYYHRYNLFDHTENPKNNSLSFGNKTFDVNTMGWQNKNNKSEVKKTNFEFHSSSGYYFKNEIEYNAYCNTHTSEGHVEWLKGDKYDDEYFKGYNYFKADKFSQAIFAYSEALKFNPVGLDVRFGMAECYIKMKNLLGAKTALLAASQYCIDNESIANLYKRFGYIAIEEKNYELAFACYTYCRKFEQSELIERELYYITRLSQKEFNEITSDNIPKIMARNNVPFIDSNVVGKVNLYDLDKDNKKQNNEVPDSENNNYENDEIEEKKESAKEQINVDEEIKSNEIEKENTETKVDTSTTDEFYFQNMTEFLKYIEINKGNGRNCNWLTGNNYLDEYKKAYHLFDMQKYKEAIDVYNNALKLNPIGIASRFEICECYIQLGDFNKAKETLLNLSPLLSLKNDAARYYRRVGFILTEEGFYDAAAACHVISYKFEQNPAAIKELAYITGCTGKDYKYLFNNSKEVINILVSAGVPLVNGEEFGEFTATNNNTKELYIDENKEIVETKEVTNTKSKTNATNEVKEKTVLFCRYCGNKLTIQNAKFCNKCGKRIE